MHLDMPMVRHKDRLHWVWPEVTREGPWTLDEQFCLWDPATLQSSPALA